MNVQQLQDIGEGITLLASQCDFDDVLNFSVEHGIISVEFVRLHLGSFDSLCHNVNRRMTSRGWCVDMNGKKWYFNIGLNPIQKED